MGKVLVMFGGLVFELLRFKFYVSFVSYVYVP